MPLSLNVCHTPAGLRSVRIGIFRFTERARMTVSIKNHEDIEKMRIPGRLAADVLEMIELHGKAGVTTEELDRL